MPDPTPTARRPKPVAPPAIEIPGPGVYPLETRECPEPAHWRTAPSYCVCQATDDRVCWMVKYGESGDGANPRCSCACHSCDRCHGTGHIPDENAAKVEIKYRDHRALGWQRWGWYWRRYTKGSNRRWMGRSGPVDEPFPTPAEAFADAQETYRAGR